MKNPQKGITTTNKLPKTMPSGKQLSEIQSSYHHQLKAIVKASENVERSFKLTFSDCFKKGKLVREYKDWLPDSQKRFITTFCENQIARINDFFGVELSNEKIRLIVMAIHSNYFYVKEIDFIHFTNCVIKNSVNGEKLHEGTVYNNLSPAIVLSWFEKYWDAREAEQERIDKELKGKTR